jgi:large subunit ribosomal protein L24
MKLKKGDNVIVIAGKSRGKTGTISRVIPREDKVVIDGVNIVKRHRKPRSASQPGTIVDRAMPIHVSNVMLADPSTGKPTRIKISRDEKGMRTRVSTKSGVTIK